MLAECESSRKQELVVRKRGKGGEGRGGKECGDVAGDGGAWDWMVEELRRALQAWQGGGNGRRIYSLVFECGQGWVCRLRASH